jgi:predicted Ser/Thr protein kinase
MTDLNWAKRAAKALGLPVPVGSFGSRSAFGKVFELPGNKIMKVMPVSVNTKREIQIARIAGNANIGPRVHNVRKYDDKYIMVMNKVLGARTLTNAIRLGVVKNFANIEAVIKKLHAKGIHHGNLHGDNILVYTNANGRLRLVPIDFGAATYNATQIHNLNSAVRTASRGATVKRIQGVNYYTIPGRLQASKSNKNSLELIRKIINNKGGGRNSITPPNTPTLNSLPRSTVFPPSF